MGLLCFPDFFLHIFAFGCGKATDFLFALNAYSVMLLIVFVILNSFLIDFSRVIYLLLKSLDFYLMYVLYLWRPDEVIRFLGLELQAV